MMDRETWLRRILVTTRDLADGRYQERVWVRGEGPEVDSSTEALTRLMDDYDLPTFIAEAAERAWISNEQLAALRKLDAALARYAAADQAGWRRCDPHRESGLAQSAKACRSCARNIRDTSGERLIHFPTLLW